VNKPIKCSLYYTSSGSVESDCLAIESPSGAVAIIHPHSVSNVDIVNLWKFSQGKLKGHSIYLTSNEMNDLRNASIVIIDSKSEEMPF